MANRDPRPRPIRDDSNRRSEMNRRTRDVPPPPPPRKKPMVINMLDGVGTQLRPEFSSAEQWSSSQGREKQRPIRNDDDRNKKVVEEREKNEKERSRRMEVRRYHEIKKDRRIDRRKERNDRIGEGNRKKMEEREKEKERERGRHRKKSGGSDEEFHEVPSIFGKQLPVDPRQQKNRMAVVEPDLSSKTSVGSEHFSKPSSNMDHLADLEPGKDYPDSPLDEEDKHNSNGSPYDENAERAKSQNASSHVAGLMPGFDYPDSPYEGTPEYGCDGCDNCDRSGVKPKENGQSTTETTQQKGMEGLMCWAGRNGVPAEHDIHSGDGSSQEDRYQKYKAKTIKLCKSIIYPQWTSNRDTKENYKQMMRSAVKHCLKYNIRSRTKIREVAEKVLENQKPPVLHARHRRTL